MSNRRQIRHLAVGKEKAVTKLLLKKFPRTAHLPGSAGAISRAEKLLAPKLVMRILSEPVIVEEKVDGANLGIWFEPSGEYQVQNRGSILSEIRTQPQFGPLFGWLAQRRDQLFAQLGDQHILFGEWLFARHTVYYDHLPDFFLAFDLFDRARGSFLARAARSEVCGRCGIAEVPCLYSGILGSMTELQKLLGNSKLTNGPAEGVYVRLERDGLLEVRAKFVRRGWVSDSEEHWSHRPLEKNRLRGGADD
jgi:hypothetical protein